MAITSPRGSDHEANPEKQPMPTTPRRSTAVRRPHDASTPRRSSANKTRTPNSAPVRVRSSAKKPEPTLLGDFLLGRPSPSRIQRKSLDGVKGEIKAGTVNKLQPPGGVRDRVKQWQKDNAAAMSNVIPSSFNEPSDRLGEDVNGGVHEEERVRIKNDLNRPDRRVREISPLPELTKAAPRKRVVSDDHWMKRPPESGPQKLTTGKAPGGVVRDFVKTNSSNPSLESKIDDWAKRVFAEPTNLTELSSLSEHGEDVPTQGSTNSGPMRKLSFDDGIRVKPIDGSAIDGSDSIRKSVPKEKRRRSKEAAPMKERKSSYGNYGGPLTETLESNIEHQMSANEKAGEEPISWDQGSPTRKARSRRKFSAKMALPDIPVGSSAFSVLDIPVGGDAGTVKPSKPQRTPSLSAVPKVLKKVYNEGMKIVHDTVDPPRSGQNQPRSIESWLNSTSDPFVHHDELSDRDGLPRNGSGSVLKASVGVHDTVLQVQSPDDFPEKGLDLNSSNVQAPETSSAPPPSLKRSPARRNASSPMKNPSRTPSRGAISDRDNVHVSMDSSLDHNEKSSEESPMRKNKGQTQSVENLNQSPQGSSAIPAEPSIPRRPLRKEPPSTGVHQLSTIASVETLTTASSQMTSSQTTFTQPTSTDSYVEPNATHVTRQRSIHSGLKRRLTKHSDLMSILSLPDTSIPGRSKSIRSARSVRTTRSRLDTATVEDLMREVADDEVKYMRELKTLVDGVIPVLLTSVLSKSADASLFDLSSGEESDASITKPIVDMGIALERLKSLHKRLPLEDPTQFAQWAYSAHKIYDDYLRAWRIGFQDIIVNLAPASSITSDSVLDEMPRNADGDVVNTDGQRVDVAFLLKRPLVRIKYLAKATKGIRKLDPSRSIDKVDDLFQELLMKVRRRTEEEKGRQEDILASKTDATRARDLRTLSPLEGVKIERTRQVRAKDYFEFDLHHSSGQRMVCQVELLLRDRPNDLGDVLICEVDARKDRWLLFAPVELHQISARRNDGQGQLVVMIRGVQGSREWRELFVLTAENDAIATEWVEMLGSIPLPPPLKDDLSPSDRYIPPATDAGGTFMSGALRPEAIEVPIGEKKRSEMQSKSHTRRKPLPTSRSISTPGEKIADDAPASGVSASTYTSEQSTEARRPRSHSEVSLPSNAKGNFNSADPNRTPTQARNAESMQVPRARSPGSPELDMPFIPKQRQSYSLDDRSTPRNSDVEKETVRNMSTGSQAPREDGAPEPPPHRSPNSVNVTPKKPPLLASLASKFRNRRSSSPLKHEYQPSNASATSSASESDDSDESPDSGSDSSDDELEAPDPPPRGGLNTSAQDVLVTIPASNPASTSQVLYPGSATPRNENSVKLVAAISCWSEKGHWDELYSEDCSIVVSAGLIEAYIMSASHSAPAGSDTTTPLVAQVLTPVVPLRQSTALDIEIRSPPLARSRLKSTDCVRFRTRTLEDCRALYAAIHRARLDNPEYKRLEQERMLNSYGGQSYQAAVGSNRRRSWFGRQKSYRASTRAPSATTSDESAKSFTSAILGRLRSGSSGFNIEQSSIDTSHGPSLGPSTSVYASSSDTSGITPPRTPSNPSIATTGATNTALFKTSDLKIRLYFLETASKWADLGAARLTVTQPPPGMRQASSLYQGVEKRIIVTSKHTTKRRLNRQKDQNEEDEDSIVLLDVVLGARCFSRQGVVGIAMNIWEDIVGDNGEVGHIGAVGGVSGRTRKYMFQCSNAAQAMWIYTLVGGGGRG